MTSKIIHLECFVDLRIRINIHKNYGFMVDDINSKVKEKKSRTMRIIMYQLFAVIICEVINQTDP